MQPCRAPSPPLITSQASDYSPKYKAIGGHGAEYSLQKEVPYQCRLVTAFLVALGRDAARRDIIKTGRGHSEFRDAEKHWHEGIPGMPDVWLRTALQDLPDTDRGQDRMIRLSAKSAEGYLRRWFSKAEQGEEQEANGGSPPQTRCGSPARGQGRAKTLGWPRGRGGGFAPVCWLGSGTVDPSVGVESGLPWPSRCCAAPFSFPPDPPVIPLAQRNPP